MSPVLEWRHLKLAAAVAPQSLHESTSSIRVLMQLKCVHSWAVQDERYGTEGLNEALDDLDGLGVPESQEVYFSLLRQCGNAMALAEGKRVHAHIVRSGYDHLTILGNLLITMYGKCRSMQDASAVFASLVKRNVYSWTTMIAAYAQNGHLRDAEGLFEKVPQQNFASWNAMITAYVQNGRVHNARRTFDAMPHRDVVSWNAMIVGYAQNGLDEQAYELFQKMHSEGEEPNAVTFLGIVDACGNLGCLAEGKLIHSEIALCGYEQDVQVATAIVGMYGKCGSLDDARRMFEKMPQKNVVSWTAMVVAYAQNGYTENAQLIFDQIPRQNVVSWTAMVSAYALNGHGEKALLVFRLMELGGMRPNKITFISAIDACANMKSIVEGRILHSEVRNSGLESDTHVGGALVNMYGKCACVPDAKSVFDRIPEQNEVAATAMICGYAECGEFVEALKVFRTMDLEGMKATRITFVSILDACNVLKEGKEIHARIVDNGLGSDMVVGTALTSMYRKCGSLEDARSVFHKLPRKNVITWTTMIGACIESGDAKGALDLFRRMDMEGTKPDDVILTSILDACAKITALAEGKAIHLSIENGDFELSPVGSALIDMYGKCGSVLDAKKVFDKLPELTILSWTAMITAYAQNGHGVEAVKLFKKMELEGLEGNEITLVCVLNACSHSGMTEEGLNYFFSLSEDRGLAILPGHYVCLLDLFGRAGQLDLAEDLISMLPLEVDLVVAWTALLGACKTHGDMKRAARAAQRLMELDPEFSSPYVVLSNVHAAAGDYWEDCAKTKKAFKGIRETRKHNLVNQRKLRHCGASAANG